MRVRKARWACSFHFPRMIIDSTSSREKSVAFHPCRPSNSRTNLGIHTLLFPHSGVVLFWGTEIYTMAEMCGGGYFCVEVIVQHTPGYVLYSSTVVYSPWSLSPSAIPKNQPGMQLRGIQTCAPKKCDCNWRCEGVSRSRRSRSGGS